MGRAALAARVHGGVFGADLVDRRECKAGMFGRLDMVTPVGQHGSMRDVFTTFGLALTSFVGGVWGILQGVVSVGAGVAACVMAYVGFRRYLWDRADRLRRK